MDCCLCSSLGNSYRPPRNTVCVSCYEGARSIIDLCRKLEQEWRDDDNDDDHHHLDTSSSSSSSSENNNRNKQVATPPQGLAYAFKQMKHLELKEEDASEKLEFLESLVDAFRLGMHSDVELVTNDGLSLHAHRVVMVSSSLSLSLSAFFSLPVLVQDRSWSLSIFLFNDICSLAGFPVRICMFFQAFSWIHLVLLLGFDIILALAEIGSPSPHLATVDCSLSEESHEAEFVLHLYLELWMCLFWRVLQIWALVIL